MDISNSFSDIFDLIFGIFKFCFDTLDSITFFGISLLDFSLSLIIISLALPLVVTLLNRGRRGISNRSESRRNSHK